MRVGDLVIYSNPQRMISPTLGIITEEHHGISMDTRFFSVLLPGGKQQLITENYLLTAVQNPVEG